MKSLKGREQEIHSDCIVPFEKFFLLRNNTGLPKMTNNHHHLLNIHFVPGTTQSSFFYFHSQAGVLRYHYPHSTEEETEIESQRSEK